MPFLVSLAMYAIATILALLPFAVQGIDFDDTVGRYLATYGIQVEEHFVITEDGYVLGVFRLPRRGAPVVLFQHGILSSSWFWISNDPGLSAAIQVHSLGYDVWMPNNRGNRLSLEHTRMKSSADKAFWNFTFAEMARLDLPANINHILSVTGKETLTYVGHSEGTTQFFAAMGSHPTNTTLRQQVNLFVALSPVAYLGQQSSLLLRLMSESHVADLVNAAYPFGILTWSEVNQFEQFICVVTGARLCKMGADMIVGHSDRDTDLGLLNISAHFPAGTSVKNLNHFAQLVDSGRFLEFDYGEDGNIRAYGQKTPPPIVFGSAQVPTALFVGEQDNIGDPADAARIASDLSGDSLVFRKTFAGYSHMTWGVGDAASFREWFPELRGLLQKYNPTTAELHI